MRRFYILLIIFFCSMAFAHAQKTVTISPFQTKFEIDEGNTSDISKNDFFLNLSLNFAPTADIPIFFNIISKSAREGIDFEKSTTLSTTLNNIFSSKDYIVDIKKDDEYEHDEFFELVISLGSSDTTISFEDGSRVVTITIHIVDDDNPPSTVIDEGDTGSNKTTTFILIRNTTTEQATVVVCTNDGTALISDNDYEARTEHIFFDEYETAKKFEVSVNGDTKFERVENFKVKIVSSTSVATFSFVNDEGVIVPDDLAPTLELDTNNYSINEKAGTTSIVFRLSGLSDFIHTFIIRSEDGSAISGSDFVPVYDTIVFPPNVTETVYPLNAIIDDNEYEGIEFFSIIMTESINGLGFPLNNKISVDIVSDDPVPQPPKIALIQVNNNVSPNGAYTIDEEDDGLVTVTVRIFLSIGSTQAETFVFYTNNYLSATPNQDYIPFVQTVTFQPLQTEKSFDFFIVNDRISEQQENFSIYIKTRTNNNYIISPPVNSFSIFIEDNDALFGSYSFPSSIYHDPFLGQVRIVEGDTSNVPVTITFSLNKISQQTTTIVLQAIDTNARFGSDHLVSNTLFSITILPKTKAASTVFYIVSDQFFEFQESFYLHIVSLSNSVTLAMAETLVITIIDEDFDYGHIISTYSTDTMHYINNPKKKFIELDTQDTDIGILITRGNETSTSFNFTQSVWVTWDPQFFPDPNYNQFASNPPENLATLNNKDFYLPFGSETKLITFYPNEDVKIVSFTLNADFRPELDEILPIFIIYPADNLTDTYTSTINPPPANSNFVTTYSSTVLDIENDDTFLALSVEFNAMVYDFDNQGKLRIELDEGNIGTGFPTKTLYFRFRNHDHSTFNGLLFTTTLNLNTNRTNSTVDGNDFLYGIQDNYKLDYLPGNISNFFSFAVELDNIYERDESLIFEIVPNNFVLSSTSYFLEIVLKNDDFPSLLSVEVGGKTGTSVIELLEGNSARNTTMVTIFLTNTAIVETYTVITEDRTANSKELDYTAINTSFITNANPFSFTFEVDCKGDTLYEEDELYKVKISGSYFSHELSVKIINDETNLPTISYISNHISLIEGNTNSKVEKSFEMLFFLEANSLSGAPINIYYRVLKVQATEGIDFNIETGRKITIPVNGLAARAVFTIIPDNLFESDESFVVEIYNVENAALKQSKFITLTIVNDDAVPLPQVHENESFYILVFAKDKKESQQSRISVRTVQNTAEDYGDFFPLNDIEIVFEPFETIQIIKLPIINDDTFEFNENFRVEITTNTSSIPVNVVHDQILIVDDETPPEISLLLNETKAEGDPGSPESFEFFVRLSHPAQSMLSIFLSSEDRSAKLGLDYELKEKELTFPPRKVLGRFTVFITPDYFVEETESFVIKIADIKPDVLITKVTSRTAYIIDDDLPPSIPVIDDDIIYVYQDKVTGSIKEPFESVITAYVIDSNNTTITSFSTTNTGNFFELKFDDPSQLQYGNYIVFKADNFVGTSDFTQKYYIQYPFIDLGQYLHFQGEPATSAISVVEGNENEISYVINIAKPANVYTNVRFKYRIVEGGGNNPVRVADNDMVFETREAFISEDKEFSPLTITTVGDEFNEANESFYIEFFDVNDAIIKTNTANSFTKEGILINDDAVEDVQIANWRLSPNNDGIGYEKLMFRNIERYPKNSLVILDKWGNEVYFMEKYDNITNVFEGKDNRGVEIKDGVYFFILRYEKIAYLINYSEQNEFTLKGFIYIRR